MSAFGALFSTKHLEDGAQHSSSSKAGYPACGGPGGDAAAGGNSTTNEPLQKPKLPVYVPPRPRPPARIPVRTRGLRSDCGDSIASSPPGTPGSSGGFNANALGKFTSPKTALAASATAKLERAQESPVAPPPGSCFDWWGGSPGGIHSADGASGPLQPPPAPPKPTIIKTVPDRKASNSSNSLELSDMCCFRGDGNRLRRTCDPIMEDKPEEKFDKDVNMLELQSLLRHHHIEPSNALIHDLVQWQCRSMDRNSETTTSRDVHQFAALHRQS